MAEEIQDRNGCLTTIEIDEDRFKIAKSNFEKANLKNIEQNSRRCHRRDRKIK